MFERVDDEQQRLIMIDFKTLVDHPFELQGITLHFGRFHRVLDLAIRAEQAAAETVIYVVAKLMRKANTAPIVMITV